MPKPHIIHDPGNPETFSCYIEACTGTLTFDPENKIKAAPGKKLKSGTELILYCNNLAGNHPNSCIIK